MKNLRLISIIIMIIPIQIFPQWIQQNINTTNTLLDIQFVNQHVGYVSEDHGKIFKTLNNGLEWIEQNTGTTDFLNSITFIDENNGWALGLNTGVVIKTANGGEDWNTIATGIGANLTDVQFINSNIGWIVGYNGQIYKTINGGANWTIQTSNTNADLWSVHFIDANVGFATGVGIILKTTDGGSNWTISYQSESTENVQSFKSIYFIDTENGWAVGQEVFGTGNGAIIHTSNGGETWIKQESGISGYRLQAVHFIDNLNGFACGGEGTVLSTTDGGSNWNIENTETTEFLRVVYAIDSSNVFVAGVNGALISNKKSLNFTMNWSENTANFNVGSLQPVSWEISEIEKINLDYTIDGGKSWINIVKNYEASIGNYLWKIPNNPSIYCRIRISDASNNNVIDFEPFQEIDEDLFSYKWFFTIYGQNKWTEIIIPEVNYGSLTDIKFFNDMHGIAWGRDVLLKTTDGGFNWVKKNAPNFSYDSTYYYNFKKTFFLNENLGWGAFWFNANNEGGIYCVKIINEGQELIDLSFIYKIGEDFHLSDIFFEDESNGWITISHDFCSNLGYIFRTKDGGISWEINYASTFYIYNLNFIGDEIGLFLAGQRQYSSNCGSYDVSDIKYRYTIDNGETWEELPATNIDYGYDRSAWIFSNSQGLLSKNIFKNKSMSREPYGEYNCYFFDMFLPNEYELLYQSSNKGPSTLYFVNNNLGWFAGNQISTDQEANIICMTKDAGKTWELQQFDAPGISSFFSLDGTTCWAVAGNKILRYGNNLTSTPGVWSRELQLSDNNSQSSKLSIGQSTDATSAIDTDLGEAELPPPPPTGTFDARFILDNNSSTLLDLRNSDDQEIIWTIQFQQSTEGYPITFSWDKENLPFGSFFLRDLITGSIVDIDMKLEDNYVLTNESINNLQIVYKEQFSASITNNSNWDLVSVPLAADNMEVSSLFPEATSSAFQFDGSYKSTENLQNGIGYWIKFSDTNAANVYGAEINSPISVKKGWNIIGPYNQAVSLDQIQTTPSGILSSNIYGFENGYFIADKLEVGNGYWIKTTQAGEINFGGSSSLGKKTKKLEQQEEPLISFNIIAFDGVSDSIKLTFGLDSLATNGYDQILGEQELPPLPPLGIFDVRIELPDTLITTYSDFRPLAAECYEHIINYQLGDSSLGLKLIWDLPEGVTLNLSDMFGGSVFNIYADAGEGSYTIGNLNINNAKLTLCFSELIVSKEDDESIPVHYSLSQNYPNPFNPITKVRFGIPKESKVNLTVYNVLGEQVIQLVDEYLKAGYHEVELNISNYSSGIYFYRIQAGDYVETKKMILLK